MGKIGKKSIGALIRQEHLVFILIVFICYLMWCFAVPAFLAPDESMRYQIPAFIYQNGSLPLGWEDAVRNAQWGISYGFTPYLAQIIGVFFMRIAGIFTASDSQALFFAVRLVSVLCATLTVWISFKIAGRLFKGVYRWLFVILVAFLPQFFFLASYINNDSLAILSTAVMLLAWVIGLTERWPLRSCVLLGVGMGLCAMSYYNAYGFLLCSVILFFASNLLLDKRHWREREFRKKVYIVLALVIAIAGWWFIRSCIIYQGDILGMQTTAHYQELYAVDDLKPSRMLTVQNQGVSLWGMLVGMKWLQLTWCSMIGVFGSMDIFLPTWVYVVYTAIFAAGLTGCVLRFAAFVREERTPCKQKSWLLGGCMVLAMAIPVALSVYYSYTSDFQPQGRYILSMLLPLMYFTTIGIRTLLQKLVPQKRAQSTILILLCLLAVAIAFYCYFGVLVPAYHG